MNDFSRKIFIFMNDFSMDFYIFMDDFRKTEPISFPCRTNILIL